MTVIDCLLMKVDAALDAARWAVGEWRLPDVSVKENNGERTATIASVNSAAADKKGRG